MGTKAISVVTTWIVLPLVALKIGPAEFGSYALFLSLLSILNLADTGMGSSVVRAAAEIEGCKNQILLASIKIYSSAVLALTPFTLLIYSKSSRSEYDNPLAVATILSLLLVAGQVALLPVGKVFAGTGRLSRWAELQMYTNIALLVSVSFAALSPKASAQILLIGHGISLLIAPLIGYFELKRRSLPDDKILESSILRKRIIREALAQLPIYISGVVQRELPKWGAIGLFSIFDVGRLSLLLTGLTGVGGILGMFTGIIWPQVIKARKNNDIAWARSSKNLLYGVFFCILAAAVIVLFVFSLLQVSDVRIGKFSYGRDTVALFIIFSLCVLWEHLHYVMLLAVDELKTLVKVSIWQAAVAVFLWKAIPLDDSLNRYLFSQIAAYAFGSLFIYPLALKRKL